MFFQKEIIVVNSNPQYVFWEVPLEVHFAKASKCEVHVGTGCSVIYCADGRQSDLINHGNNLVIQKKDINKRLVAFNTSNVFEWRWGVSGIPYTDNAASSMQTAIGANGSFVVKLASPSVFFSKFSELGNGTQEEMGAKMRDLCVASTVRAKLSDMIRNVGVQSILGKETKLQSDCRDLIRVSLQNYGFDLDDFTCKIYIPEEYLDQRAKSAKDEKEKQDFFSMMRKFSAIPSSAPEKPVQAEESKPDKQKEKIKVHCKRCNTLIEEGITYCPVCGERQK